MQQASPENPPIFDLITSLYHACGAEWDTLVRNVVSQEKTQCLWNRPSFLQPGQRGNHKVMGRTGCISAAQ